MKIKYPIIHYTGKDGEWELVEPYQITVKQAIITIGEGFRTDGASIPRLPLTRWIIGEPMEGEYLPAALIHDGLYSAEIFKREICDGIFLVLLKRCGINIIKRNLMYYAVRIGGGAVWARHTKQSVINARLFIKVI